MNDRPFLIAGGGIAGLAASLALAGTGRSAEVFEKAAAFQEEGAGLQMSPNAVRCLRLLGAWEAIEPHCTSPSEIHIRDGRSGALLQRIKLGESFAARFGAPYRVTHRADLLGALLQTVNACPLVTLHTGCSAARAENTDHGARLHFTDGRVVDGAAVIAADGIHSVLRRIIVGDGEPAYGGQAIYRALVPFDKVPLAIAADCVTLWLYPGGHVVHYAVSGWQQFNIVAILDSRWREDGWEQPARPEEVTGGFAHTAGPLADLLASVKSWKRFAAADRHPVTAWSQGNIALVGDAAHASLPYLAQGAAMALEDAVMVAKCVSAEPGIPVALANYARLRQPRTARIQREARRLAGIYHARGTMASMRNALLRLLGPEQAMRRNRWIYGWVP